MLVILDYNCVTLMLHQSWHHLLVFIHLGMAPHKLVAKGTIEGITYFPLSVDFWRSSQSEQQMNCILVTRPPQQKKTEKLFKDFLDTLGAPTICSKCLGDLLSSKPLSNWNNWYDGMTINLTYPLPSFHHLGPWKRFARSFGSSGKPHHWHIATMLIVYKQLEAANVPKDLWQKILLGNSYTSKV